MKNVMKLMLIMGVSAVTIIQQGRRKSGNVIRRFPLSTSRYFEYGILLR